MSTPDTRLVRRRTVVAGAVWSAPVVAVATAVPAYAVSDNALNLYRNTPSDPFITTDILSGTVPVSVLVVTNPGDVPVAGELVTFTLSGADLDWVRFQENGQDAYSTMSAGNGVAGATLEFVNDPPIGTNTVTLTASRGALQVVWTVFLQRFTKLASGANASHVMAISGPRAYAWGENQNGNLGLGGGDTTDRNVPTQVLTSGVMAGKILIDIACGAQHSHAVSSDGKIFSWGRGFEGQMGNGTSGAGATNNATPVMATDSGALAGKVVTSVKVNSNSSVALANGQIYIWGAGATPSPQLLPTTGSTITGKTVTAIAAGSTHIIALTQDNKLYGYGSNGSGQLGNGGAAGSPPLEVVMSGVLAGKTIVAIAAGAAHSLALDDQGQMYSWGTNGNGALGNGGVGASSNVPVLVDQSNIVGPVTAIAAANGHSLCVAGGKVYAWGFGLFGRLGTGNAGDQNKPVAVSTPAGNPMAGKTIVEILCGNAHSAARSDDGFIFAWGQGSSGQLGHGSSPPQVLLPVQTSSPA